MNHKDSEYALYRVPQATDEKENSKDDDDEEEENNDDIGVSGQEMAGFTCLLPEEGYLAYGKY